MNVWKLAFLLLAVSVLSPPVPPVEIPGAAPVAPAAVPAVPYWHTLNVRDFGATGDGHTDDTAAIQAVLDRGQACLVRIPAGKYRVSQLKIPPECRLVGEGANQTWLCPILGPEMIDGPILTDNGNAQKIEIEQLGILGENRVSKGLLELGFNKEEWGTQGGIVACQFRDCAGYGVRLMQNVSMIRDTYVLHCGTGIEAWGNHLSIDHCQILGCTQNQIWSPCIVRDLEIEAPQGQAAINFHRRSLISDIHISLSQSIDYGMEFEQKLGRVSGWLFDAKPGAKCGVWIKHPVGTVKQPANVEW